MYDRITVLVPLPGYPEGAPVDGFWTTDLGCDEAVFAIREDGRLVSELWHLESVPEGEQPFRNDLNCLLKATGVTRRVIDGTVLRDYSGTFRFGRYYEDRFYRFSAVFSGGILREVRTVDGDDRTRAMTEAT